MDQTGKSQASPEARKNVSGPAGPLMRSAGVLRCFTKGYSPRASGSQLEQVCHGPIPYTQL